MSQKKELTEQELEQVSGGVCHSDVEARKRILTLLKTLFSPETAAYIESIKQKFPDFDDEFNKLINQINDPSIPQAEKDKLKKDFLAKYFGM